MRRPNETPRNALPIDVIRQRFDAAAAAKNARVVLSAPTGSGKSTTLPLWLEHLSAREGGGPVIVLEPRRVACISLARYLASLAGETVGESIGYRVRFDEQVSPNTRILFVTPGMLLHMLAGNASARAAPSAIVLDEFHERGADADLCAAALMAKQSAASGPRLVFASATLDVDAVHGAVGGVVLSAPGRTYPITTEYAATPASPSGRDLDTRVAAAVRGALRAHPGDVLVFLPGGREIGQAQRALGDIDAEVLALHAGRDPDSVVAALTPGKRRRVYLSTNVAETSLTLPGVRVVIDSGLERGVIHVKKRVALALVPCAASSLTQRQGRAGRVAEGHCIRLFSEGFAPAAQRSPEVERIELDALVVRAAALGFSTQALHALPFVTPPPAFALERATARLADLGLIDDEGALTPRGQQASRLGVRADLGATLLAAPTELVPLVAAAVALSERSGPLLRPAFSLGGNSEDILLRRERHLRDCTGPLDEAVAIVSSPERMRLGVHAVRVKTALKLFGKLAPGVSMAALAAANTAANRHALAVHLARFVPVAAYVKRARADASAKKASRFEDRAPYGNENDEIWLDAYRAPGADEAKLTAAAVVLDTRFVLDDKGRVRGYGGLYLNTTTAALAEAGVGENVYGPPLCRGKGEKVRIEADTCWTYAGVTVKTERSPMRGEPLLAAMAKLIVEGRLFAGAGERVGAALFHWALASKKGAPNAAPDGDIEDFLAERLRVLGVTGTADLALVDDDDLVPDASVACGDALVFAQIEKDFPHRLRIEGFAYRSEVSVSKREVTLHFEREKKGQVPRKDPPARLLPRFGGYGVFVQRASRRVRVR